MKPSHLLIYIVKCPRPLCGFTDELLKMEYHMKICKDHMGNCPYVNIGCEKYRMIDGNVQDHLLTENYSHMKLLMEWMDNLRNDIELLKKDVLEVR